MGYKTMAKQLGEKTKIPPEPADVNGLPRGMLANAREIVVTLAPPLPPLPPPPPSSVSRCPEAKIKPLGPMLLNGLTKLINESKEDSKLRSLAYTAVGKLSSRLPQLFSKDIALVQQFLEALCKEDPEDRLCIQEALSMMAPAYSGLQGADLKLMEALVAGYIEKPELHARLVAVKFASAVFAPDHVASRYLLLLAAGDPKEEVSAEAQRVLRDSPPGDKKDREGRPTPLPPFTEMVAYIQEKASVRIKSPAKYSVGITTLAFNPASYGEMVLYLRACLAGSAGIASPLATESLAQMQTQAPAIGRYVSTLRSVAAAPAPPVDGGGGGGGGGGGSGGPLHSYVGLIRPLLSAVAGTPIMYCLLEVVAIAPDHLAEQFADKMDWIKGLMSSNREETRELASQLLAVVTAHAPACHLPDAVAALLKSTGDQSPEVQHGAVLALGYLVSRCLSGRQCRDKGRLPDDLVRTAITAIGAFVGNTSPVLSMAGCVALGEIARSGALPLPDSGSGLSKLSLVETLLAKIRSGKEASKMKEKAVMALGNFSVGDAAFPHQKLVMEGLMDSVEARQVELQLWVAESLVSAARGVDSASRHDVWTEGDAASHGVGGGNDEVAWLLNAVLTRYVPSPNPHVRHAASVWLLSIVQRLGYHSAVKCQLKEIQEAFTGMLSENDELSQDVASKGLALVYEHGTDDDRKQLVSILVETLMTGKRKPQAVTQDTEIFPGEGVGKTPEGQNLTTYKELCSLVSDLNQPDLIYKFMNLANHHAVWNSRKGAAFGFSGIARQAGAQLAPHLPLIVPRLYRYQFDPNPGVRQAMMSIWNALVPETKNTVDKYMKEILEDVISNLTVNLWRVRESSCLALKDLLRGQQLDEVIERLPEIWATLFRVRDDIKESVRKAADHALKTLSKVSVRLCDPANGASAQKTVAAILPCLLQSGISSQVEEVRSLSVSTLVKISKSAGSLLKPHVTQVIVVLLDSLTTLEPQLLNYISVRASQQEQVQMDSVRLNAAKTSPMMETVTMCLQYVDERVLAELMPRLCEMLRSGVGLSTKGGSAHVVVALTAQCPQDLAPYAGKLMVSLLNGLSDRNDVVRKSYAIALGHLVKVSKDSSVEKLLKKLSDWYLDKDDASLRSACALVVHAVSQHSPDALKQHAALALPLAFLGMHEGGDADAGGGGGGGNPNGRLWTDVWQDSVPGSSGGVRLYLPELVGVCRVALHSPSWQLKAQGAAALAAVARLHAPSLGNPFLGLVLEALLQGLQGRTWAGKEELLKAIAGVVAASSDELKETHPDQPSLEVVLDSLFKEARKDNVAYRTAALACLSDVLQSTREDRFAELAQIVFPVLEKACAGENVISTEAEDDEKSDKDRQQELVSAMFQSLGKAWPDNPTTQGRFRVDVCKFMCSKVKLSHWKLQVVVLQAMKKYTERLSLLSSEHKDAEALTEILQQMLPALTVPLENKSYSSVRSEALDVLEIVLTKLKATGQGDALKPHERQVLAASLVAMETDKLPALKDRAASLLLGMQGI
uniref:Proteasome adapter and scaffold protein ECM29 n=1 Tax=Petromyzon marinus TaxID=7757 RepID=A0AAJ7WSH5_PETMA|nr:proteasome adapter and scaffold protein ECM29 [Petromyzon marinus]